MSRKIVLVDDEGKLLQALKKALEREGYEVFDFAHPQRALDFILTRPPDLIVSDIRMPGLSGIELLSRLGAEGIHVPCILMTAYSSMETAVAAVKMGACDYLLKPFELSDFKAAVKRALQNIVEEPAAGPIEPTIIGGSAGMKEIVDLVTRIAETESTVLLQGESGTGKELIARLLHTRSHRRDRPFVPVNCSTLPEALFESEVFGHVRGSFTGAVVDKAGLLAEAEGGVLFLDEIGDLAPLNQAKLLRVLQDGQFKRVGEARQQGSDVRILAATNKDLRQEVKAGRFREDLLYRLNVVEIVLPPLRQRLEDLSELVTFFLDKFGKKHRRGVVTAVPELLKHLTRYDWPGNIRELENFLERAVILSRSSTISPADVILPAPGNGNSNSAQTGRSIDLQGSLDATMDQIELELIVRALESVQWNHSRAAAILGVTRQNLHYKIKKYKLDQE